MLVIYTVLFYTFTGAIISKDLTAVRLTRIMDSSSLPIRGYTSLCLPVLPSTSLVAFKTINFLFGGQIGIESFSGIPLHQKIWFEDAQAKLPNQRCESFRQNPSPDINQHRLVSTNIKQKQQINLDHHK